MRMSLDDWKNGWVGVDVELSVSEIEALVALLQMIKADPEQHFHLTNDYKGESGVGTITFSQSVPSTENNATLSSVALQPGSEV